MHIEKTHIWSSTITTPHSVIIVSAIIGRQLSIISWPSNQPTFQELVFKSHFKGSFTALSVWNCLNLYIFYINLYLSMNGSISQCFKHPKKKVPRWCWHHFYCLREDKIGSLKAAGKILQWITNIPCAYTIGTAVSVGRWLYVVGHRMDSEEIFLLESVHVYMQYSNSLFYNHCYLLPDPRDACSLRTTIKPPKHLQNPHNVNTYIYSLRKRFYLKKKTTKIGG